MRRVLTDDYSFRMWRIINSGAECTILSSDIKVAIAFALTSELKMVGETYAIDKAKK